MGEQDPTARDRTTRQPSDTIRPQPGRLRRNIVRRWASLVSEDTYQALRLRLIATGWAALIAIPVGCVAFFALGALRAAFDSRSLGDSLAHSVAQFWYVLVVFVLAAVAPALVFVRHGRHAATDFIRFSGYGTALLFVYLIIPAVAALLAFLIGHILIVLIVLAVVFLILLHTGGF